MAKRRLKPGYGAISRNLVNYPLARDARVRAIWRKSTKTGRWLCDLPGDDRVQFRLPADLENPRCPTGFDMDVLFLLLCQARVTNANNIWFNSQASMLQALGLDVRDRNRRRLQDALELWQHLSIHYCCWFQAVRWAEKGKKGKAKKVKGEHVQKLMPPPIRRINTNSRRVCITVAKAWRETGNFFYAQVPLPLPTNATVQNLILYLFKPNNKWRDFPAETFKIEHKARALCYKIGLNHAKRGAVLRHAITEAKTWFLLHGIEVYEYGGVHDGVLTLTFMKAIEFKPGPLPPEPEETGWPEAENA